MAAQEDFSNHEFPMTDGDFKKIREIAYARTGISLTDHKKNMIYGRLARRLRRLNLKSFREYCDLLVQEDTEENIEFVNSITTNLTSFFRENHHFEHLKNTVLPGLMRKNLGSRRIRIWSAGCSTGEEAYSIAMVVKSFASLSNWDVKVLATDLDSNVVAKAKEAIYAAERAENIPDKYKVCFSIDKSRKKVKIKDNVRKLITFKQLNLLHEWPMKGPFDIIFCRNVVIYFDANTQRKLFDRYADIMTEQSTLFIGHSESLHNITSRFGSIGRTIYERRH
ncbi:Chemotaxis protein methyltransferase [Thalassocella blandensis]|nr:Chemotaxis protein methyltransferase [Thalassocella blandensis]